MTPRKQFFMGVALLLAGAFLSPLFGKGGGAVSATKSDMSTGPAGKYFDQPTDNRNLSPAARENLRNLRRLEYLLDQVEIDFWSAASSDSARDFHKRIAQQLFEMTVLARRTHSVEKGTDDADPVPGTLMLQKIYSALTPAKLGGRRPVFQKTSMREYRSPHQEYWREQRTDTEYATGKRITKNQIPSPTLVTVDVEHYILWVTDRTNANRRRSSGLSGGKNQSLRSSLDDYCDAIGKIRVALVRMAEKYRSKDNLEGPDKK